MREGYIHQIVLAFPKGITWGALIRLLGDEYSIVEGDYQNGVPAGTWVLEPKGKK
jgi:hypothetical protein